MIFFTIPWIFVIAVAVMVVAIGYSVIDFIIKHIVVISVILWFPIAWFVWSNWKNKSVPDEEKVETALYLFLQIPTYAALIKLMVMVLNYLDNDLFSFLLSLLEAPMVLGIIVAVNAGAAWGLSQFYEKVLKSKVGTVSIAAVCILIETCYLWNNI